MNNKHQSQVLSAKQVLELLELSGSTLNSELTERYFYDVYNLGDGRIFTVLEDGKGEKYVSKEVFLSMLETLEEQQKKDEIIHIPAKRVKKVLREDPGWISEPENSQASHRLTIYINTDGRTLVVTRDGSAILYMPGKNPLISREIMHPLNGWGQQGKNFIDEIPQLIDNLALQLDIPRPELDKTEDSLDKIDRAVRRKGRRKCLELEIFPSLMTYVGEAIGQAIEGQWELRLNNDYGVEIWEPWIVAPNGNATPPYSFLYKELYEGQTCYIRNAIESEIRRLLLSSFKPLETQNTALDIYIIDDNSEVPACSTLQPLPDLDNLLSPEVYAKVREWLLQSIQYYRALGFFQKYSHLSEAQLVDEIERIKEKFENAFETSKEWKTLYLEFADPLFTPTNASLDPYLLKWDISRTWSESEVQYVCRENEEYARAVERWAEISRGAFSPQDVEETWGTGAGLVSIKFTLDRVKHQLVPEYYEGWIDLEILREINRLIAVSGYQFEICEILTDSKLVVVLTSEEKQKIQKDRKLPLKRWEWG